MFKFKYIASSFSFFFSRNNCLQLSALILHKLWDYLITMPSIGSLDITKNLCYISKHRLLWTFFFVFISSSSQTKFFTFSSILSKNWAIELAFYFGWILLKMFAIAFVRWAKFLHKLDSAGTLSTNVIFFKCKQTFVYIFHWHVQSHSTACNHANIWLCYYVCTPAATTSSSIQVIEG